MHSSLVDWDMRSDWNTCGTWLGYMRMAIAQMMMCDSVTVLPGWSESKGANIEVDLALALGIPVVLDHELLRDLLPELESAVPA